MKNVLFLLLLTTVGTSCKIDNFAPPNATLSGKLVDSETNEPIENGGVNGGAVIQIFDGNSTQPILINSFPDGHFMNKALFEGSYKLVAIGPFKMVEDTIRTKIAKNTTVDIKVIPNIRLKATLQNVNGTIATVKVEYSKIHTAETLDQLVVLWSTIDNPNIYTHYGGGQNTIVMTPQNPNNGEMIFTITGLTMGTKYYIRAAGRTNNSGNYYNYSTTLKTQQ